MQNKGACSAYWTNKNIQSNVWLIELGKYLGIGMATRKGAMKISMKHRANI